MLIDPATNKVVGEIKGIEVNHGAAVAPDGSKFYITNEAESTLDVADAKTLTVIKHIPLTNHPNNVAVSKDGKRVYVGDRRRRRRGRRHRHDDADARQEHPHRGRHPQRLRDAGRQVGGRRIDPGQEDPRDRSEDGGDRLDGADRRTACGRWRSTPTRTDRPSGSSCSSRTSTASSPSTSRRTRSSTRSTLPDVGAEKVTEGLQGAPAHGLIVTPDGKTLGVLSKMNTRIYFYSLPDLKLIGESKVGHHPDWVTGTPDGKRVLRRQRRIEFGERDRRRDAQGADADSGRTGAEAKYHGSASVEVRSEKLEVRSESVRTPIANFLLLTSHF